MGAAAVGGGRASRERSAHVTGENQNRNKMAATGDEAAAMDSISRAPSTHSATLNPAASDSGQAEGPGDAAESLAAAPKKHGTNSESWFLCTSLANANIAYSNPII